MSLIDLASGSASDGAGESVRCRAAADIGGTFTDLIFEFPTGEVVIQKRLSTAPDYDRGVVEGIAGIYADAKAREPAAIIEAVVHATTVGTNAVLERRGARTALRRRAADFSRGSDNGVF